MCYVMILRYPLWLLFLGPLALFFRNNRKLELELYRHKCTQIPEDTQISTREVLGVPQTWLFHRFKPGCLLFLRRRGTFAPSCALCALLRLFCALLRTCSENDIRPGNQGIKSWGRKKPINRKHINIFLTALAGRSSQGRTPTRPRDKRDNMAIFLWN